MHVTEGICIPLVAKPDLIRNVTIRGCGRSTRLTLGAHARGLQYLLTLGAHAQRGLL